MVMFMKFTIILIRPISNNEDLSIINRVYYFFKSLSSEKNYVDSIDKFKWDLDIEPPSLITHYFYDYDIPCLEYGIGFHYINNQLYSIVIIHSLQPLEEEQTEKLRSIIAYLRALGYKPYMVVKSKEEKETHTITRYDPFYLEKYTQ